MACMLYFHSDTVFTGQVTSSKEVPGSGDAGGGTLYTLKVSKSYLGPKAATLVVFTPKDSSRLPLEQGKRYLLFASKEDGKLTIHHDGISGELKGAKAPLKDLDRIIARKPGQGGDVFVRAVAAPYDEQTGGVAGIYIYMAGPAGSAHGLTSPRGWLHVHVPAGTYTISASYPHLTFKSQDISWQDGSSFMVPDGGCAEIQLQAEPAASGK